MVIEGIGLSRDVPCNGENIGIYGADNIIHLTGDCADVVVHGDGHMVTIEQARTASVSGADHTVNADSLAGLVVETTQNTINATMSATDGPARVTVSGADQTLNLAIASEASIGVDGTNQVINWEAVDDAPDPQIDIGGIDNAVNRIP